MKLYHVWYLIVKNPEIKYSDTKLDFGKGFYTTDIVSQANKWASVKALVNNVPYGFVTVYKPISLLDINKFNSLIFNDYNEDWLDFIIDSRNCIEHLEFDCILGPLADSNTNKVISKYNRGLIDRKDLLNLLQFKTKTNQLCVNKQSICNKLFIYDYHYKVDLNGKVIK